MKSFANRRPTVVACRAFHLEVEQNQDRSCQIKSENYYDDSNASSDNNVNVIWGNDNGV